MAADIETTVKEVFQEQFDRAIEVVGFAPGRVNLIGEHTDYNGGHVFPSAITNGTYGVVAKNGSSKVNCYSTNFEAEGIISFDLDELKFEKADGWTNFVKGMIHFLKEKGYTIDEGFDMAISGNIPNGAGLSSSASLELLVGVLVRELFGLDVSQLDLIKIGQQTENHFIGVNSGIMDQFAVGMGETDHALFLDTNTLEYEKVPADFKNNILLIMNTNKRRELSDSKYNQRRSECEEALKRLQSELDIQSLGELTPEQFEESRHLIGDDTLERRAKHAVYENQRTVDAVKQLRADDLEGFAHLMDESHKSLRDDYEVTGIELDTLVEAAWKESAVLGARMTGAGMGGCAIALVNKDDVEAVKVNIQKAYVDTIGYEASFYVAAIGNGANAHAVKA